MTVRRGAAALAIAALLPLTACGGDPQEDYCAAVQEHQAELSDITADGGPEALLDALDVFRALQDEAPGDIADEWQQVVDRLEALEDALDAAGVDPSTYDSADPPADLDPNDRSAIEGAARELVSEETASAFEGLQQQARDVCKTPLSL